MNKSQLIKTASVLVPVLTLGVIAGSVSAAESTQTMPSIERHIRVSLTDEQKTALNQIRELREAGKADDAKALAKSVGLPDREEVRGFHGRGGKMGPMNEEMRAKHEAVRTAIGNNDYAAFKTASADTPFATEIDEAKFAKLVEASKLMKQAEAILTEAGIKMPFMHGMPPAAPAEAK